MKKRQTQSYVTSRKIGVVTNAQVYTILVFDEKRHFGAFLVNKKTNAKSVYTEFISDNYVGLFYILFLMLF